MAKVGHSPCRFTLDTVQHLDKWTPGKGGLLGFAHLRCGHHLHRFGDLSGAADRADPAAQIAWTIHNYSLQVPKLSETKLETPKTDGQKGVPFIISRFP